MTDLRVALVGCGRMGADLGADRSAMAPGWLPVSHAGAVAAVDGLTLVAVVDPDENRCNAAGDAFGVAARYAGASDMLAAEKPDIVCLATRTPGRAELIAACAAAGVRGLHLEKPIATSLAAARLALAACEAHRVKLSYGATRRFMEAYRKAAVLVADGAIGSLGHIAIEHGSDLLMWGHPHSTDLMLFFAGSRDVRHVQADLDLDPVTVAGEVVDADPRLRAASVLFADGVVASVSATGGLNTRLTGSLGTLAVLADGTSLELRTAGPKGGYFTACATIEPAPVMSGTQRALAELRDAVRSDGLSPIDAADIEAGLALLLAMARSAVEDGRRVDPALLDPGFTVTGRYGDLTA